MMEQSAKTTASWASNVTTEHQPLPSRLVTYPKPSATATDFLECTGESDFRHILFDDKLVTVSDTGKELGEFSVTISLAKRQDQDCFLVHANSHGFIDGVPCGTSIVAYVSKTLETIEQQHHEYVKLENHALDKKTFVVMQGNEYVVTRVVTQGEQAQRTVTVFSKENMKGFISEGSNLLLLRLLVKKGVPDDFQLISFDADANLCATTYKPLAERSQGIGDIFILVSGIERVIHSPNDLPTTWQSYFDQFGRLTSRVQVGSPVTMRVTTVPEPLITEEEPPKPTFSKTPLDWEDDVQMFSKFLDRKDELKDDHALYARHHPELKALLSDFLQFLLLRKPDDVLNFAAEYFASFSTKLIDVEPYATSTAPTPFPSSRANTTVRDGN